MSRKCGCGASAFGYMHNKLNHDCRKHDRTQCGLCRDVDKALSQLTYLLRLTAGEESAWRDGELDI